MESLHNKKGIKFLASLDGKNLGNGSDLEMSFSIVHVVGMDYLQIFLIYFLSNG